MPSASPRSRASPARSSNSIGTHPLCICSQQYFQRFYDLRFELIELLRTVDRAQHARPDNAETTRGVIRCLVHTALCQIEAPLPLAHSGKAECLKGINECAPLSACACGRDALPRAFEEPVALFPAKAERARVTARHQGIDDVAVRAVALGDLFQQRARPLDCLENTHGLAPSPASGKSETARTESAEFAVWHLAQLIRLAYGREKPSVVRTAASASRSSAWFSEPIRARRRALSIERI